MCFYIWQSSASVSVSLVAPGAHFFHDGTHVQTDQQDENSTSHAFPAGNT